jgi:hypothetical protein
MALPLISHFFCSRKLKVFNLLYLISLFYFVQENFVNLRHLRLKFLIPFVQEKFNRWKDSSPYFPIPFSKKQSSLSLCTAQQWGKCLQWALNSRNCLPVKTILPYTQPCIRLPATLWMLKLLHHQVRPDNWGMCSGTMPSF